jgi:hypothetical protein
VRRATGEVWTVRVELRNEPMGDGPAPVGGSLAAAAGVAPAADPLIDRVMSALDARLLKVDDGFGRAPAAATAAAATAEDEPDEAPAWDGTEEE